jgi:hypothetical protein
MRAAVQGKMEVEKGRKEENFLENRAGIAHRAVSSNGKRLAGNAMAGGVALFLATLFATLFLRGGIASRLSEGNGYGSGYESQAKHQRH